jgi:single-stranded-DNA-specific exonuclease
LTVHIRLEAFGRPVKTHSFIKNRFLPPLSISYEKTMDRKEVQETFLAFLNQLPPEASFYVLGHSDADGLTAAAILTRSLRAKDFRGEARVTRKGENAWSSSVLERIKDSHSTALIVADLGSREDPLIPDIPTLLLDHHKPTGVPPGAVLLSGYGMEPTPTSGLLAFHCAEVLGTSQDLDWLAAISILADLGDKTDFPEWREGRRKHGSKNLREAATLLNAPRRAAEGDAQPALELLLEAPDLSAFLSDKRIEVLHAAKAEYNAALAGARRAAPKFNQPDRTVALLTVNTSCQVHPVLAQMWIGRLKDQIVICANTGFLPDRVNFAVRTKRPLDLISFLANHKPTGAGPDFGRGHDQATGGSLTPPQWEEFLRLLGF